MNNAKIFTVGEINNYIKNVIQNDILLSNLHIKGEISNFKLHSSGHAYFTLKDMDSRIKCVMFRASFSKLKFLPEDGLAVILRGHFSVYDRDGQYQLYAEDMVPEGIGALYKAYEQLKNRLAGEGLFDTIYKKSIPYLPKAIGIVTSPTGAAVRDIISIIKRRCAFVDIILYPVLVQGENAATEISEGINYFNKTKNVDVIIAGRGGGSIEELWAFNEEAVARAIFDSEIPVVSAVGHETDFTIADFVADLRAPTPSAAAELVVPDKQSLAARLNQATYNLNMAMNMYFSCKKHKIEYISKDNAFKKIEHKMHELTQTLDILEKSLDTNVLNIIKDKKHILVSNIEKLDILNPASALLRGYAYIRNKYNNSLVASVNQIEPNDDIEIQLKDGCIYARVQGKISSETLI